MKVYSLGSGSSGNAFLAVTDGLSLLIDCGVPVRACKSAIRDLAAGNPLAAIVVSHEHSDHVRSIPSVMRGLDCPLIATHGTHSVIGLGSSKATFRAGDRYADGAIEVTFVDVSHDAAEPCGFIIEADGTRVAIFTDLGFVSGEVLDAARSADIIVLESNYDVGMLRNGRYPARLKRRIQSPRGHLSNDDCASALVATVSDRTRAVWLAHLSHNNNHAEIAETGAHDALRLAGLATPVRALPRYDTVEITATPPRQMGLGF